MTALVPNPNDELLLKNYQNALLNENNKKELKLLPSLPLFYIFEEQIPVTKNLISSICETKVLAPKIFNDSIISKVRLFLKDKSCFNAELVLAKKTNPSAEIIIPEKGFIKKLKVFRLAEIDFTKENNVVSWSFSDSLWKKL